MLRWGVTIARASLALGLIGAGALTASAATARRTDGGVLNQTQVQDPVGDSSGGPDLSSLTVTTYSDGTVSFAVGFANRDLLHPGETVQIFVDLDDDGSEDLNLSIWPFGEPSYLARWTGSDWVDVRQLSELVEINGSFSVRISLASLRDAAGVPIGSATGVAVAAWPSGSGTAATDANDWLPDDRLWVQHQVQPPAPTPPPTTTTTTTTPPAGGPPTSKITLGETVDLNRRTRTHGCALGPLPDRRCSPGAYYAKLTKAVICSPSFRTSTLPQVTRATKRDVELEYGLAPKSYGKTLEIDRIVPLELGGSNSIANLYPEKATFSTRSPGYHVKDRLEHRLSTMVCSGQISLPSARRQLASSWEKLYETVYRHAPSG
jgi:hypothetical protein